MRALAHRAAGRVGRPVIRATCYVTDLTYFSVRAFRDWWKRESLLNRATLSSLYREIIFNGVDAIPVIFLLGIASGIAVTAQILSWAHAFGTEHQMIQLLVQLVGLELSSLLTAIALIGHSGSAIVVELGNMRLRDEIEGLSLLGINVNDFFVTPRLIALSVSQLILAIYLGAIALFGGIAMSSLIYEPRHLDYMIRVASGFDLWSLALFGIKNLFFGLIIGATACFHGLRVDSSPNELPQQTQAAIISSVIMILLLNGILSVVTT